MWSSRGWVPRLALGVIFLLAIQGGHCEHEPTESECRPYIERALKEHHVDSEEPHTAEASIEQEENPPTDEQAESNEDSQSQEDAVGGTEDGNTEETAEGESIEGEDEENKTDEQGDTQEEQTEGTDETTEAEGEDNSTQETDENTEVDGTNEENTEEEAGSEGGDTAEETEGSQEASVEGDTEEQAEGESQDTAEEVGGASQNGQTDENQGDATGETDGDSQEGDNTEADNTQDGDTAEGGRTERDTAEGEGDAEGNSQEIDTAEEASQEGDTAEEASQEGDTVEEASQEGDTVEEGEDSQEGDTAEQVEGSQEGDTTEQVEGSQESGIAEEAEGGSQDGESGSQEGDTAEEGEVSQEGSDDKSQEGKETQESTSEAAEAEEGSGADESEGAAQSVEEGATEEAADDDSKQTEENQEQDTTDEATGEEGSAEGPAEGASVEGDTDEVQSDETEKSQEGDSEQETPEEDLTMEAAIPANLRPRDHITQILKLELDSVETESARTKNVEGTLRTLKNIYDTAIKPLELLFKYRDLSNRHFGDPEIFSKPLVLFMGPWSGGKSSTINYLLDNEFTEMSLRTGAEPSPAYFNILMHGEEPEILDGTQLAADWTFSGLQKFGQGLLDRLRGVRLPNRLLEKVNIVEIPGILEIRKQVQRLFPFNDACQWFIDRADIIFLVYDPAKLDVGPETEAILDQLKGREYQTRIILNKADQVKPEELMRVQGTLIWNISPLMSSPEPPVMYTTSLWSLPYEAGAPTRLLFAQERAFLRDLREAIDKRVDNKIASARRFAVRVRNHAKMVDCYLTTYYNHKSFFGNRKAISDDIIENPTKYHIYEGLSTLTNISRYDLPDPDMYRDFFRLNPLYDFTKLSDTCTYFRGCPINKLDVAIAYDLPELVGKYKKAVEAAKHSHS